MIKLSDDIALGSLIDNQFGEQYLVTVNRNNFEQLDYQTQFNKEFGTTFNRQDTLYIITGTDSGLMVKHLLSTPPEKGSAYLFIEFPEIIELTKDQYNLDDHKRIIVTTPEQWQDEAQKIGLDIYLTINKVKSIKSFAAQYYYLYEYLLLWKALEDSIKHLAWQYQSQLGSNTFIQRQLENLAENHTPAIALKDYFQGKSALILAGGPSLDHYIDWIEQNQQHYIVIAVTRIARKLIKTRIKPDIFVSVDPHISNFNVSNEVYHYEKDSVLVNQYHVSPVLLGNWLGANLYLGNLLPWATELNRENLTGIGPTVTNTAILLAIKMGIKQQLLFGVDLCFSPEGYSHASGSHEHDRGPDINQIGQIVETNSGQQAETNSAYYEAIEVIEKLAELANESGGELVNPSPDSTRMKHVAHRLIADIEIPQDNISIADWLANTCQQTKHPEPVINHCEQVMAELKKVQYKIEKIQKFAEKGLEYNQKLFAGNEPEKNYQFKLKMDKLEKELNHKDLTELTEISKKFGFKEFLYFIQPDSERDWTDEEIKNSAQTYYKALKSGATELSKHIFTAINRTETRMLEQGKIMFNDDLIKRHLCSFDRLTSLANRSNEYREKLQQNTRDLIEHYYNDEQYKAGQLSKNNRIVLYYLVLLQHQANYQFRRQQILDTIKPDFWHIAEDTVFYPKTGETLADIKKLHQQYLQNISTLSENKDDQVQRRKLKLEGLESKLYNLFLVQDGVSIQRIIDGIHAMNQEGAEEECQSFLHLANGYLYELTDEVEQAVNEYGYANHPKTIESALKRIAYITLNSGQIEFAHTTLQILADISPVYLPQLADLYRISKHYKHACDSYSKYLEFFPDDINIMIKLGDLYQLQDIKDGAQFVYEHILQLDPDNQMAKTRLEDLAALAKPLN